MLSGPRMLALRARWARRLVWYQAVEVVFGSLIVLVWAVLLGLKLGWIGAVVLSIICLYLHFAAVESGQHLVLWLTTILLLVVAGGATSALLDQTTVSYVVASVTVLIHNELVRLNFARRRRAIVDDAVFVGSATALGLVALVSVLGIGLAEWFAGTGQRSWLWMPVAAAAVGTVAVLLTALPARRHPMPSRQRWRPGDRIPPPPLGSDSDLQRP